MGFVTLRWIRRAMLLAALSLLACQEK